MSVSADKSVSKAQGKTETSFPIGSNPESFFLSAYDDQIQLVERLFLDGNTKGNNGKKSKKKKNKTAQQQQLAEHTKETQLENKKPNQQTSDTHKHLMDKVQVTHKSRIYRYHEQSNDAANPTDSFQPLNSAPIIQPPIGPMRSIPGSRLTDSEDNVRSAMLMSWYHAGYHTGYYDAIRKMKQMVGGNNCSSDESK